MRFFPLNLLLALGLFCLNALLGAIQYRHRGDLFAYGKFSFDPKPEQQFSGNFFQSRIFSNDLSFRNFMINNFAAQTFGDLRRIIR